MTAKLRTVKAVCIEMSYDRDKVYALIQSAEQLEDRMIDLCGCGPADLDFGKMVENLPDQRDQVALMVTMLDAQVSTGGFRQWIDNGYAINAQALIDGLTEIGTPTACAVQELIIPMDTESMLGEDCGLPHYDDQDVAFSILKRQLMADLHAWYVA